MNKNIVAKPIVIGVCVLILLLSLVGCNRWQSDVLSITEVRTTTFQITENETGLAAAWYTPVPTTCVLLYCQDKDLCLTSEPEPDYGTLHLFTCTGLPKNVKYFIIRATDETGETIEESFDNPLLTK